MYIFAQYTFTAEVYCCSIYCRGGEKVLNFSDILRALTDTLILAQLEAGDSYGYQINKSVKVQSSLNFEKNGSSLVNG